MPAEGGAPILITMGEPAGVGPELALAAFEMLDGHAGSHPLMLVGDPAVFGATAAPVIPTTARASRNPGKPDPANAAAVTEAIAIAVDRCLKGEAAGLVTAPIHKAVLAQAGFPHPGHTEYLGELTGARRPVMMLASDTLRVVPLTIHMPIAQVPAAITRQALFDKLVAKAYESGKALNMASYLEIDAVIDPADTRAWLLRGLNAASGVAPADTGGRSFIDTW